MGRGLKLGIERVRIGIKEPGDRLTLFRKGTERAAAVLKPAVNWLSWGQEVALAR